MPARAVSASQQPSFEKTSHLNRPSRLSDLFRRCEIDSKGRNDRALTNAQAWRPAHPIVRMRLSEAVSPLG